MTVLADQPTLSRPTHSGVQVISNCATVQEFVLRFRRFCSGTSLFVPTEVPVEIGSRDHFSIRLRDGETVLSGLGEVIESQSAETAKGGSRMVGMRIDFVALDAESQSVFQWMLAARKLTAPTEQVERAERTEPAEAAELAGQAPGRAETANARSAAGNRAARPVTEWRRRVAVHGVALVVGLATAYQIWGA